jgi:ubiquinone/menaquinone biosynthesis C-methylase UbiE
MPELEFRTALVRQANVLAGHRVLDFGCGTGTLTLMVEASRPGAEVVGVDVDRGVLTIARDKLERNHSKIALAQVSPGPLPFPDRSFDRVLSCLVFHHLRHDEKLAVLGECRRVLHPGGEIHIADWGLPTSRLLRAGFLLTQLLDGFETTDDNVCGRMPDLICQAGCDRVVETDSFATALGSLRLLRGTKQV